MKDELVPLLDPFTRQVLRRIPDHVRAALAPDQWEALKDAVQASRPRGKHLVDLRMGIPLFFAKYYLVVLLGRDRRTSRREAKWSLRKRMAMARGVVCVCMALSPLLLLALLLAYRLKCAMGINIFAQKHLSDFLPF